CASPDGGSRTECLARVVNGSACVADRDCQVFSRCVQGKCAALPSTGSPCLVGQCLVGVCEPTDAGPICDDLGGPDAPCSDDSQCVSQRCLNGKCLAACSP